MSYTGKVGSFIDIEVYEGIVNDIESNADSLKMDVNKVLEDKEEVNGTWVMESFYSGESKFALETVAYRDHVVEQMVPLLRTTESEFQRVDEDGHDAIAH